MKINDLIGVYFIFIAVGMFVSGAVLILMIYDADYIILTILLVPLLTSLFIMLIYFKELVKAGKKIKELG